MSNRLDFVIFGATGFTGQYTVEEVVRLLDEKPVSWGVAGRNKSKLESLLKKVGVKFGKNLSSVEIIVADVGDGKSLETMAARAKVVINCCGPYRHWGEQVVKACVESGAHHVDVSGEPQYMERMQLEYHEAAAKKGIYIVSACGFDSIPSDLGLVFLQNQFKGDLNSVEVYIEMQPEPGYRPPRGAVLHYGTYESAVYGVAHANELRPLREKLFPTRLPKMIPTLKPRSKVFKSNVIDKWCVPFLGADASVMKRSQRILYENEKKRPAQVQAYVGLPSLLSTIGLIVLGGIFMIMSKFSFGRQLLLKHPKFFTLGAASHEGPSEESMKRTLFTNTLVGEGWEDHVPDPVDIRDCPPNKRMIVKVKGRNPGYGATCTALVLSGYTVLKESDKMPGRGGVYPPGAAFAKTSLIEELNKHGLTFEVVS